MNSHLFLCNRNSHHYSIYPFQIFGGQLEAINDHDLNTKTEEYTNKQSVGALWELLINYVFVATS